MAVGLGVIVGVDGCGWEWARLLGRALRCSLSGGCQGFKVCASGGWGVGSSARYVELKWGEIEGRLLDLGISS